MKISIYLNVNKSSNVVVVDLKSLNTTQEEWLNMSQEEQKDLVEIYAIQMNDQPYWVLKNFNEIL